ncbi:MAG: protein kinase, partial [Calditrichia bacterium]
MIGKTILHYRILEQIGQGGMGVVYKAEDTKLERTVALKFLAVSSLGGDSEKERFKREAKAAAALNHPNIAHIYAIDEEDEQLFIAMEYIKGKSIDEIAGSNGGSPLSVNKAIDYAKQIAAGLQAAHEKGIVHRDIKSANIMITERGVVKIMDFGLAKLSGRSMMTQQGTTLGTVAYMSPEQARGEEVDTRSDIWSLGVVLYEMISGQLPFHGDYEQAVIYSILNEEPEPLTALRSGLPIALDGIVAKALAKDPDIRYQHVEELPADLKGLQMRTSSVSRISTQSGVSTLRAPVARTKKTLPVAWIISAVTILTAMVYILWIQEKPQPVSKTQRFNLSAVFSDNQQILRLDIPTIALSPDGKTFVYALVEKGVTQLYLRPLDSFESRPIPGTENGTDALQPASPFFSPDGQWLGFLADGKIKKIPVAGGAVETICDAAGFRGASWSEMGSIVFSPAYGSGLMRVAASGGEIKPFSRLDSSRNERTHRWPQVLPGGEWVLFTIGDQNNPNSYINAHIALQSLKTGERHLLNVRGEMARYVEPGYLIVSRGGVLLAAPFNLKNFKTSRPLTSVVTDVDGDAGSGISYFTTSNNGNLVYLPGTRNRDLELVWVDLQGKVVPINLPPRPYNTPRISPDGKMVSVTVGLVNGNNNDIWIYDLQSAVFNKFTFGNTMFDAIWSRDGKRIYFASGGGDGGVMVKPADGSSGGSLILAGKNPQFPVSISPDGNKMILNKLGGTAEGEIFIFDLDKQTEPYPLFESAVYEYSGHISPNGQYLVYGTNETGKSEIYVRTYPDMKGKWQISTEGGAGPLWAPDGTAIYYINNVANMMAVPVKTIPKFRAGKPRVLFDVSRMNFPNNPIHNYDISPDGKRFIMVRNTRFNTN